MWYGLQGNITEAVIFACVLLCLYFMCEISDFMCLFVRVQFFLFGVCYDKTIVCVMTKKRQLPNSVLTPQKSSNHIAFADNSLRMKTMLMRKAFAEHMDSRTQFAERSSTSTVCRKTNLGRNQVA
jgi:hypothetical protein